MEFFPEILPLGREARVSLVRQTFPMTSSRLESGEGDRIGQGSAGSPGTPSHPV